MGNKVDLIEEIRARLAAAMVEGGDLESIKRIKIGSSEEARTFDDFPIINIPKLSGDEGSISSNKQFKDEMTIQIDLIIKKLASDSNVVYDTSDLESGLYLLEKTLNALDKNTSGVVDIGFAGKAYELRRFTWEMDSSNELLIFSITINVHSKYFTAGAR